MPKKNYRRKNFLIRLMPVRKPSHPFKTLSMYDRNKEKELIKREIELEYNNEEVKD